MKHTDPFYLSAPWRAVRGVVLERDGYRCTWLEAGVRCVERAAVVDHIVTRSDGGAPLDPSNCRSLCRLHDAQRHREKGGRHD